MKKSLEQCKSGKDFTDYALTHGGTMRQGKGSHVLIKTERGAVVVPVHNSDLGTGLRHKIIKAFLTIGISILLIMLVIHAGII